ncbi:RNA polymerase sigma-70 factor (ECF subfamily) [Mucilaginibacter gracilis]|uniref:RNA polymerase sigma-70 factor (ECF subfamily) n=1 Tax=Mucilaginibacter gracilis TaxID=423350 RepID=A0A495IX37_9SPHI|nr:RNA polymerase sigma factor [Mucilaginibacter gracilis]RKR80941.1 RNA polymerase sigma-70 factor (ECF subfamily) [Mucilaginibacter gracilis]
MIANDALLKIWNGCLKNEGKQEELFYKLLAPRMMAVCMRYARDRDEAQDILQEGFIKAFKNRFMFRGEGSLEGWIRRIMVHTALSHHRKNAPVVLTDDIAEHTIDHAYRNDSLEAADLLKLINSLPDNYRSVFNMYAIEGYSHQEIGATLGMTEIMSRTSLHRARAILKSKLNKLEINMEYRALA